MHLYLVKVIKWDETGEPETFSIEQSIPFTCKGIAEEMQARGKFTPWHTVAKCYFYPHPEDAASLGIKENSLLYVGG